MNRIENKFQELKKKNKKAFIAFITAGYPDLNTTEKLITGLADTGVDIIELGIPFSDPMADGKIIQESSQQALKKGVNLNDILKIVKKARFRGVTIPICFMSYYNPIFCFGCRKFAKSAKECGVDGIIVPDLPPEESHALARFTKEYGIDIISFITPTTNQKRMKLIAAKAKGFIYYISITGVTGERKSLSVDLSEKISSIRKYTAKPVCVGFGVSNNQQVKQILKVADGVIVGSVIIKKIKENIGRKDMVSVVVRFVRSLIG